MYQEIIRTLSFCFVSIQTAWPAEEMVLSHMFFYNPFQVDKKTIRRAGSSVFPAIPFKVPLYLIPEALTFGQWTEVGYCFHSPIIENELIVPDYSE